MQTRTEHDSMGEIQVPADRYWGAQTQRSLDNFRIGERMPAEIIHAFGLLKKAAALANRELCPARMTEEKLTVIRQACDEVAAGALDDHFPLVVFEPADKILDRGKGRDYVHKGAKGKGTCNI